MATPVGHTLAGYAVAALVARPEGRPMIALAVVMANAPDLDFLPGLLVGMPALYHQGVTHSLGFGVMVSAAAAAGAFRLRGTAFGPTFGICLLAYASHLALDALGTDARPPYGQRLLWPLSDVSFGGSLSVLPGVRHASSTSASTSEWLSGIFSAANVGAVAIEALVLAPLVYGARRRQRAAVPAGAAH
jgi:membrane-bound metal-dependent hydrolase YbcI (DUF457 family)